VLSWREARRRRLAPGDGESGAAPNWDFAAFAPAGGLVSTSRDLARFLQACLGFKNTSVATALEVAAKPWGQGGTPGCRLGLAWQIERRDGPMLLWHGGATGGYRSFIAYDPDRKLGIVVLANDARGVEEFGFTLLAGRLPSPPVSEIPAAPVEALLPYLGNYPLAPSLMLAITATGGQLFAQATNQPRLPLQPIAPDRYAVAGSKAEIVFERGTRGTVAALVLRRGEVEQRAPRLGAGERPPTHPEIVLRASLLARYAGRYEFAPGSFLTVTAEDGKLFAQAAGQSKIRVFAEASNRFFYKVVDAQLIFDCDAAGRPVAVILHQDGHDRRGEKR